METIIKTTTAIGASAIAYFFGGADMWLRALVTMIAIDYIMGLSRAYVQEELSSKIGFKGIIKKVSYFALVAVAVIADDITGAGEVVRTAVIGFLIANEALSIVENYSAITGQKAPGILVNVLNKLKDNADKD